MYFVVEAWDFVVAPRPQVIFVRNNHGFRFLYSQKTIHFLEASSRLKGAKAKWKKVREIGFDELQSKMARQKRHCRS